MREGRLSLRKENGSVFKPQKVHSSQRTRSCAQGSRCRSRNSFVASLLFCYTRPCRSAKPCKFRQLRLQWTKCGENLRTFPTWTASKVKCKQDVINEARANNRQVQFATLMDFGHLKHEELAEQLQTFKGSGVARRQRHRRHRWSSCIHRNKEHELLISHPRNHWTRFPACQAR